MSDLLSAAQDMVDQQQPAREDEIPGIKLGTPAFTAAGWPGSFYPAWMQPRDFHLPRDEFNAVETDSNVLPDM